VEAAAQAPVVEVEYQYEEEQAEEELNLAADPALPGICESDLRRIPVAPVELVEVFVPPVIPMFRLTRFSVLCSPLSTATETKQRLQSAAGKVDYRD
jgi:hypothetical protein